MDRRSGDKSVAINVRVSPEVKRQAEEVLELLGIPMSTAIDMYLRQIALTGSIPFELTLPVNLAHVRSREVEQRAKQAEDQMHSDYRTMARSKVHNSDLLSAMRDTNRHRNDE